MEEELSRSSQRDKILTELKSITKQVYHEAVNHELSPDNITYITQSLLKRLEESLVFGLKNPQNGFWKIVQKILHPDSLSQLINLPGFNKSNATKGRSWICHSILDDVFVSYMNCFILEKNLDKFYEQWSILKHNDSSNYFFSILSGIENVSFQYELTEAGTWPTNCKLSPRLISLAGPWSPSSSCTDSGVQLDRSDDYLNGNVPSAAVVLRRRTKDTQRHVSFHEDSLAKSPSQRKLRWDVENSRYSWAGEELDALKLPGLGNAWPHERGVPEGEEAPQRVVDVKPVTVKRRHSIGTRHGRRLSTRKFRFDFDQLSRFNQEVEVEIRSFRRPKSLHIVELPDKLQMMLGLQGIKTWTYKLWGKVVTLTLDKLFILHRDLHSTILTLAQIEQVVVFPHAHEIHLLTRKHTHKLRCGEHNLSHEILTRLAFHFHRSALHNVNFRILQPDDMIHVKQELVNRRVLTPDAKMLYIGLVRLQPTEDTQTSVESIDKQGSLMYQTSRGSGWLPANLILRGGVLYLYGEGRSPIAAINLATSCGGCERSTFPDRPHTFTLSLNHTPNFDSSDNCFYQDLALKAELTPNSKLTGRWMSSALNRWTNGKPASEALGQWVSSKLRSGQAPTSLHFAAADEYEMSEWLQALLTVFCQGSEDSQWETEASEASLLITEDTTVLFTEPTTATGGFRLLASALIHEISAFNVGSHPQDSYCTIEMECMEAGSATFDWVLHFGSRAELDQCLAVFEKQWQLSESFPFSLVEDARCERTQDCLAREWFA